MKTKKTKRYPVRGVTGHRRVMNYRRMCQIATRVVHSAKLNNVVLSIGGAGGWDLAIMKECVRQGVRYILRLAFKDRIEYLRKIDPALVSEKNCILITWEREKWTNKSDARFYFQRNERIIKDVKNGTEFYKVVETFWDYRNAGGTFKTVELAIEEGIHVQNHFDDMHIHTMDELKELI